MTSDIANSSARPMVPRGVYTLANDAVIEWFEAFIRNFRKTHPVLPLTVIPYNRSISRLQSLAPKYQFSIMDESDCDRFDALEAVVMGQNRSAAMFRKWACFFGPYADFIFLDADIIVTSSLDEILTAFSTSTFDLLYFDVDMSVVYASEAADEMKAKYGSAGFIAGAFVSRRGTISHTELFELSHQAARDRNKFIIDQVDQPFLNYVFDLTGRRKVNANQILPKFAASTWARQPFTYDCKTNTALDAVGKIMPFIHWAGCAYPTMVRPEIFLHHRTSGLSPLARTQYEALFYLRRWGAFGQKAATHWKKIIVQFLTSSAWRKFYLFRLIGIKSKLPT